MDVSIFLARVIGLYLILVCSPLLLNHKKFLPVLRETVENAPIMLFSGVMAVVFGILILVTHNVWTADWRVLITLTGWMALIKGMVRFVLPDQAVRIANATLQTKSYFVMLSLAIIIGICLIYHGFFV
jgi:hypothetical protein